MEGGADTSVLLHPSPITPPRIRHIVPARRESSESVVETGASQVRAQTLSLGDQRPSRVNPSLKSATLENFDITQTSNYVSNGSRRIVKRKHGLTIKVNLPSVQHYSTSTKPPSVPHSEIVYSLSSVPNLERSNSRGPASLSFTPKLAFSDISVPSPLLSTTASVSKKHSYTHEELVDFMRQKRRKNSIKDQFPDDQSAAREEARTRREKPKPYDPEEVKSFMQQQKIKDKLKKREMEFLNREKEQRVQESIQRLNEFRRSSRRATSVLPYPNKATVSPTPSIKESNERPNIEADNVENQMPEPNIPVRIGTLPTSPSPKTKTFPRKAPSKPNSPKSSISQSKSSIDNLNTVKIKKRTSTMNDEDQTSQTAKRQAQSDKPWVKPRTLVLTASSTTPPPERVEKTHNAPATAPGISELYGKIGMAQRLARILSERAQRLIAIDDISSVSDLSVDQVSSASISVTQDVSDMNSDISQHEVMPDPVKDETPFSTQNIRLQKFNRAALIIQSGWRMHLMRRRQKLSMTQHLQRMNNVTNGAVGDYTPSYSNDEASIPVASLLRPQHIFGGIFEEKNDMYSVLNIFSRRYRIHPDSTVTRVETSSASRLNISNHANMEKNDVAIEKDNLPPSKGARLMETNFGLTERVIPHNQPTVVFEPLPTFAEIIPREPESIVESVTVEGNIDDTSMSSLSSVPIDATTQRLLSPSTLSRKLEQAVDHLEALEFANSHLEKISHAVYSLPAFQERQLVADIRPTEQVSASAAIASKPDPIPDINYDSDFENNNSAAASVKENLSNALSGPKYPSDSVSYASDFSGYTASAGNASRKISSSINEDIPDYHSANSGSKSFSIIDETQGFQSAKGSFNSSSVVDETSVFYRSAKSSRKSSSIIEEDWNIKDVIEDLQDELDHLKSSKKRPVGGNSNVGYIEAPTSTQKNVISMSEKEYQERREFLLLKQQNIQTAFHTDLTLLQFERASRGNPTYSDLLSSKEKALVDSFLISSAEVTRELALLTASMTPSSKAILMTIGASRASIASVKTKRELKPKTENQTAHPKPAPIDADYEDDFVDAISYLEEEITADQSSIAESIVEEFDQKSISESINEELEQEPISESIAEKIQADNVSIISYTSHISENLSYTSANDIPVLAQKETGLNLNASFSTKANLTPSRTEAKKSSKSRSKSSRLITHSMDDDMTESAQSFDDSASESIQEILQQMERAKKRLEPKFILRQQSKLNEALMEVQALKEKKFEVQPLLDECAKTQREIRQVLGDLTNKDLVSRLSDVVADELELAQKKSARIQQMVDLKNLVRNPVRTLVPEGAENIPMVSKLAARVKDSTATAIPEKPETLNVSDFLEYDEDFEEELVNAESIISSGKAVEVMHKETLKFAQESHDEIDDRIIEDIEYASEEEEFAILITQDAKLDLQQPAVEVKEIDYVDDFEAAVPAVATDTILRFDPPVIVPSIEESKLIAGSDPEIIEEEIEFFDDFEEDQQEAFSVTEKISKVVSTSDDIDPALTDKTEQYDADNFENSSILGLSTSDLEVEVPATTESPKEPELDTSIPKASPADPDIVSSEALPNNETEEEIKEEIIIEQEDIAEAIIVQKDGSDEAFVLTPELPSSVGFQPLGDELPEENPTEVKNAETVFDIAEPTIIEVQSHESESLIVENTAVDESLVVDSILDSLMDQTIQIMLEVKSMRTFDAIWAEPSISHIMKPLDSSVELITESIIDDLVLEALEAVDSYGSVSAHVALSTATEAPVVERPRNIRRDSITPSSSPIPPSFSQMAISWISARFETSGKSLVLPVSSLSEDVCELLLDGMAEIKAAYPRSSNSALISHLSAASMYPEIHGVNLDALLSHQLQNENLSSFPQDAEKVKEDLVSLIMGDLLNDVNVMLLLEDMPFEIGH